MPKCATCGSEHDVLDPTFQFPDAWARLDDRVRTHHTKIHTDLCEITLPAAEPRFFIRGVLPVDVRGYPDGVCWGIWAEVSENSFKRVLQLWDDPEQASEPEFEGRLENVLPSYPDTRGLPLLVQLSGPTTRPYFRFGPSADHDFVRECIDGVDLHRAAEWNQLMEAAT